MTGEPGPGTGAAVSPRSVRGLLLVRAAAPRVREWVAGGLGPCVVVPYPDGWTAIVPQTPRTYAAAPFDDAVAVLLGRPIRRRLLPTIGVALVGERLVIGVVPAVLRPRRSWIVWEPGRGLVRPSGLSPATVAQLAAAAGRRDHRDSAAQVLADGRGTAGRVLIDLFRVLGLPGAEVATGARPAPGEPDAVLVEPSREDVGRFDRTVHEVRRWREEVEGNP